MGIQYAPPKNKTLLADIDYALKYKYKPRKKKRVKRKMRRVS